MDNFVAYGEQRACSKMGIKWREVFFVGGIGLKRMKGFSNSCKCGNQLRVCANCER